MSRTVLCLGSTPYRVAGWRPGTQEARLLIPDANAIFFPFQFVQSGIAARGGVLVRASFVSPIRSDARRVSLPLAPYVEVSGRRRPRRRFAIRNHLAFTGFPFLVNV